MSPWPCFHRRVCPGRFAPCLCVCTFALLCHMVVTCTGVEHLSKHVMYCVCLCVCLFAGAWPCLQPNPTSGQKDDRNHAIKRQLHLPPHMGLATATATATRLKLQAPRVTPTNAMAVQYRGSHRACHPPRPAHHTRRARMRKLFALADPAVSLLGARGCALIFLCMTFGGLLLCGGTALPLCIPKSSGALAGIAAHVLS